MGYSRPTRGIYYGDSEWREENDFCWFTRQQFDSSEWQVPDPDGKSSSLRLVNKISERVSYPPDEDHPFGAATAVYVADSCSQGSSKSREVIAKIVMRIPYVPMREGRSYVSKKDLFAQKLPATGELYPEDPVGNFEHEVDALQYLTKHKCAYTPSLIATHHQIERNPWVKEGFVGFIIMEKLPGVCLSDIWEFEPSSNIRRKEQLRVQEAFMVGFITLYNLGVGFFDKAARNLIWDSEAGKCYFVDFEQVGIDKDDTKRRTWEELASVRDSEWREFVSWNIITKDQYAEFRKAMHSPGSDGSS